MSPRHVWFILKWHVSMARLEITDGLDITVEMRRLITQDCSVSNLSSSTSCVVPRNLCGASFLL